MSETSRNHKEHATPARGLLIITCSTSRFQLRRSGEEAPDPSGDFIEAKMREFGHTVVGRSLIPDDPKIIRKTILGALQNPEVDSIIITGGTGISRDDVTVEVVEGIFDKKLPGFGEIFRRISYDEIGSSAVLSRATAGVTWGKPIFCLPGSPDAVRRSLEKIILPELPHILKHLKGG
ncbi:MAG: MogA/MoaB family molybdenum cofactor biosynthesis protein [Candidatus Bathyarchaeia archaeon]|nr:MogA/MoaB family molybdenum cofactor biosynthesis protein [Candidatus Bathyarchaeota archaeon]